MRRGFLITVVGVAFIIWMIADPQSLAGTIKAIIGGFVAFIKLLTS